jgi:hypothetical protein
MRIVSSYNFLILKPDSLLGTGVFEAAGRSIHCLRQGTTGPRVGMAFRQLEVILIQLS